VPPKLDQSIIFDNAAPFQSDWLGVGANYMGFVEFAQLALTAQQKAAEYQRAYNSGIKIASTWCGQDWAYATYPTGSADWNSASMLAFYTWLQAMKDFGIMVILKTGWHFPNDVCGISTPLAPSCTPTPTNETTWKTWVSELLNQTINVRGFTNIYAAQFFTEPNVAGGPIPGGYTPVQYYSHLISIARAQIAADDASRTPILPRIKIIGPSEFSFTTDEWTEDLIANNPSLVDIYAAHSYCDVPTFGPLGLTASNCPAYSAWNALFANWAGDTDPKGIIADEGNMLVGGDDDSVGYRATADAGMQWCRLIDGHMQAGCKSSLFWMLQDQKWVGTDPYQQEFGIAHFSDDSTLNAAKPSWRALSMHANLTGGGNGTSLCRAKNDTATIHGTGVQIPFGVRLASTDGEHSFVLINEGPAFGVKIRLTDVIPPGAAGQYGRTFYRHTYTGEYPAPATAELVAWDQKYDNVQRDFPVNVVPGHSVVIYSTIPLAAPTAPNLALDATATSDSTGFGAPENVCDGNFTNVSASRNGWRKGTDAPAPVILEWPTAVTFSRLELAFVGTTDGVVWADYATTAAPAPLADYTIEYWNGSAYVEIDDVIGNTDPNATHTFASITATRLKVTANSAAATAQINNIGVYAT
jgi:hypothetical protein